MWIAFHRLGRAEVRFVGALGRALVLAQNFEENCKFVYTIATVAAKFKSGQFLSLDQSFPFAEALHRLMLGRTLKQFQSLGISSQKDTTALGAAKDARNHIVHSSGHIVLSGTAGPRFRAERGAFEGRVRILATGDALVSKWSCAIQEKSVPPAHWARSYPDAVTRWVITGSRKPPTVETARPTFPSVFRSNNEDS